MPDILDELEVELLLTAIQKRYGYDFHNYARTSICRRLASILQKYKLSHLGEFQHRILNSAEFFYTTLDDLTITVSDFFRDPIMYQALLKYVFPTLQTYFNFKVWHAGCARGEEVYSTAILLRERDLYDNAVIYATDINKKAIEYAKNGLFSKKSIEQGKKNYLQIHNHGDFDRYVSENNEDGILESSLRKNIVFSRHNLVTDQSFGEMQLIICRNVLIYFNKQLQLHVLKLFTESLSIGGYLCLGTKETLNFSGIENCYKLIDKDARIYQKIKEVGA